MPENAENLVDYTEYLKQISEDVAFLQEQAAKDLESSPAYEAQLQDVIALLTELKENKQNNDSLDNGQLSALVVAVQGMEKSVTDVLNVNSFMLCGIGLLIGVICALIFSRFVRS